MDSAHGVKAGPEGDMLAPMLISRTVTVRMTYSGISTQTCVPLVFPLLTDLQLDLEGFHLDGEGRDLHILEMLRIDSIGI